MVEKKMRRVDVLELYTGIAMLLKQDTARDYDLNYALVRTKA